MKFLILACLFISLNTFADRRGNGGDLIRCRANASNFLSGDYVLDYVLTLSDRFVEQNLRAVRNWSESKTQILAQLNRLSLSMAASFEKFTQNITVDNGVPDYSKKSVWIPRAFGPIEIDDEQIDSKIPNNCLIAGPHTKPNLFQLIVKEVVYEDSNEPQDPQTIRQIRYMYDTTKLTRLYRTRPLQFSFAMVHEWLRTYENDSRIIRPLNYLLHSRRVMDYTSDQFKTALYNMGVDLNELGPAIDWFAALKTPETMNEKLSSNYRQFLNAVFENNHNRIVSMINEQEVNPKLLKGVIDVIVRESLANENTIDLLISHQFEFENVFNIALTGNVELLRQTWSHLSLDEKNKILYNDHPIRFLDPLLQVKNAETFKFLFEQENLLSIFVMRGISNHQTAMYDQFDGMYIYSDHIGNHEDYVQYLFANWTTIHDINGIRKNDFDRLEIAQTWLNAISEVNNNTMFFATASAARRNDVEVLELIKAKGFNLNYRISAGESTYLFPFFLPLTGIVGTDQYYAYQPSSLVIGNIQYGFYLHTKYFYRNQERTHYVHRATSHSLLDIVALAVGQSRSAVIESDPLAAFEFLIQNGVDLNLAHSPSTLFIAATGISSFSYQNVYSSFSFLGTRTTSFPLRDTAIQLISQAHFINLIASNMPWRQRMVNSLKQAGAVIRPEDRQLYRSMFNQKSCVEILEKATTRESRNDLTSRCRRMENLFQSL